MGSGGLASPPLMTFVESDRPPPHGMLPLPPPETPGMTQEPMPAPSGFFTAPPGIPDLVVQAKRRIQSLNCQSDLVWF